MNLSSSSYQKSQGDIDREMEQVRMAQKDPKHFEPLYDRYYLTIARFVANRVEGYEVVNDITQEVFIRALKKIKAFKPQGVPFSAWLFRIASNLVMDHLKKQNRERVVNVQTERLPDLVEDLQDAGYGQEQVDSLIQALRELPSDDLQLIELRFFEKRSVKETAGITGMSEANVKTRVHRIIKRLKNLIGHETEQAAI